MEIVYLAPAIQTPIGGIKVIYRHSEMLNALGINSSVFHPEAPSFVCDWFSHQARIRPGRKKWFGKKHEMHETPPFDPQSDFLVIPEVWANQIGQQCQARQLRYAIFVQNGYMVLNGGQQDPALLERIYCDASLILSISQNTTDILRLAFPALDERKIIPIAPNLSSFANPANTVKKKMITWMPKKLPRHAQLVEFLMRSYLPSDWQMVAIENQTERAVHALLQESAIFLSFCDAEGFGLPPLEAALCGNVVVGYTGEGAKEYFDSPIFQAIHQGDYLAFIAEVRQAIARFEQPDPAHDQQMQAQRAQLMARYGQASELKKLQSFANAVYAVMGRA